MTLFIILAYILWLHPIEPDTWVSYGPRTFFTYVGEYVAEIFPPRYRLNMEGSKTLCYMYHFEQRKDGTYKFTLLWSDSLRSYMPDRVFLTDDGHLITLDPEHFGGPHDQALVIYSPRGAIVRSFPLDSLLNQGPGDIVHSVTARWWYNDARFFYFSGPSRFYVLLKSGKGMEFRLADGYYTLAPSTSFPVLQDHAQRPYSNSEFHNRNYLDLVFSSITEILNAHSSRPK